MNTTEIREGPVTEQWDEFDAPWSTALRVMTTILAPVLLGVMLLGLLRPPVGGWIWYAALVATPLLLLVAALFCMVRRYVLTAETLFVQRPGRVTRIELDGLQSVAADAHAMVGSKRLFANGGLFVFAGRFRNRTLGIYRALLNDPDCAVVLRWPDRRLVIGPDDPERFVRRLSELRGFEVARPDARESIEEQGPEDR